MAGHAATNELELQCFLAAWFLLHMRAVSQSVKRRVGATSLNAVAVIVVGLVSFHSLGESMHATLLAPTDSALASAHPSGAQSPRLSGHAQAGLGRFFSKSAALSERAATSYRKLPSALREWMWAEQHLLSRELDTARIKSPAQNAQTRLFAPESAPVFEVETFWLDATKTHLFVAEEMSPQLRDVFVREGPRGPQVRLLVHPESRWFYRRITRRADPGEPLFVTPTASSRTLLTWQPGNESAPFFVKVSLDKRIGGIKRGVRIGEIARSSGFQHLLTRETDLPSNFRFFQEVLSMIAEGVPDSGMIVRAIPDDIVTGESRFVPVFSLYADQPDGGPPMLAKMIAKSGESASAFIAKRLIEPFADEWSEVYHQHGITSAPHGQNLLVRVDDSGLIAGQFVHRDLGGFDVHLPNREQLGRAPPRQRNVLRSYELDYHQDKLETFDKKGELFFGGGVLYNLDQKLGRWMDEGWIPREELGEAHFQELLRQELGKRAPPIESPEP